MPMTPGAVLRTAQQEHLSQDGRLLRSHFPHDDGPDAVLVVNTLFAQEELSRGYRYDVELLSDDASIPLKAMIGKMMTVSLLRDNGSERHFNGYITEFRYTKTDGGFVYYYAVLEPWLAMTRLRKDCASFKNCTVTEMTGMIFSRYQQRDWKASMVTDDPKISYMNQYNETDYNHLHRRWEAAGYYYWYEHRPDGHTFCLADNSTLAGLVDACGARDVVPGTIPFRAFAGSEEGDGISQWQAVRRMGSGETSLASFDYKRPIPWIASRESDNEQGKEIPPFELYENLGEYGYRDGADGEALARRRMEEADRMTQYFEAAGNDRCAMPGRCFALAEHHSGTMKWPVRNVALRDPIAKREYLILSVRHWAGNNIHSANREPSYYRNELTCQRRSIRWRPGRRFHSEAPPPPGVQTAIVTGPAGEEIYTDGYGRIKVQFHWDRESQRDENSSAWIRVAMPMAGAHLGQIGLPRVGQEVVVQFLGENPDRPIVTGVVYNERHKAPWDLPFQRALSGLRSRELGGRRGNQLVLDDTNGQIQAQLRSDHLHSQLSLGRIHRIEGDAGHKEARGEGFELRTDGHGVVRAGQGVVITSEGRAGASGHAKAMGEVVKRLQEANRQQESLARLAQQHDERGGTLQTDAAAALERQQAEIAGTGDKFPELSAPHMVLASAAGLASSAAQSVHLAAGEQVAVTAGANVSVTAQGGLFASARQGLRMFVHKMGMRLIAAAGRVELRAETDEIEILAQKVLYLISDTDWVELRGRKGVRLHGAGSMIEISDKVQVFSPSPTKFHCNFETLGPQNRPQPSQRQAKKEEEQREQKQQGKLAPVMQPDSRLGAPYTNVPYVVTRDGVEIKTGITDDEGRAIFDHEEGTGDYRVSLGNDDEFSLQLKDNIDRANASDEHAKSNQGHRALNDAADGREHDI